MLEFNCDEGNSKGKKDIQQLKKTFMRVQMFVFKLHGTAIRAV